MDLLQQTVTDVLVERIRNEIIRGNFRPGERLRLRDLADRYKVSTMPVREALQLLQAEGLVTGEPRKGVTVTQLSAAELEDIYDMRATLEAMATRLAVPHVSAETIATLQGIVVQIDKAQGDAVKVVELNTRFHTLLYAASGRTHLCSVISMLRRRAAHYFHAYMNELGTIAQHDHRMIIEACQRQEADRAAEIMHEHIARAGQAVVASLAVVAG
jgi:DNA-binding GntR family transcriptional regulator